VKNPYVPILTQITDIVVENEARDIKTFRLAFSSKEEERAFSYLPGQFAELSLYGAGECPIGIASSPTETGYLLFTVKRVGSVTTKLHRAECGEHVGVRGPLGNTYPLDKMRGHNVLVVSGGFAFTTLRSTIRYIIDDGNRDQFKRLTVIYGARSPGELLYKQELTEWEKRGDVDIYVTVDKGDSTWNGREGFVPAVLKDVAPDFKDTVVLVCGPPIMIKFTIPVLQELHFPSALTYLSLEMRMKCGIGKCGRCNIGHKYVCKDGPVFSYAELEELPQEY
jgi:NAD(P)H-flavin reductase